jgi:hypothetical protein
MSDEHKLAAVGVDWRTDITFRTVQGQYTKVHCEVSMFRNNKYRYYIYLKFL